MELRAPLHSPSGQYFLSGTTLIERPLTPVCGSQMILVHSWDAPLYTSCKAGCTRTNTTSALPYHFLLGNSQGEKWYFRSLKLSYSPFFHSIYFKHIFTSDRYAPGDFCIFFSSTIYHQVAPFEPLPQTRQNAADGVTPGRIGTVLFFPQASLQLLKDKPARWGYRTAFGKNEHLFKRGNSKSAWHINIYLIG